MNDLEQRAKQYIEFLCGVKPHRRTGSPGNRAATDYFARTVRAWGGTIDATPFPCLDHNSGAASLAGPGGAHAVYISPYALGCAVTARLVAVATPEELASCCCRGEILLLRGELCAEPLMPKNFTFYNPDHHKKIYALLEEKQPAAIITATEKNLHMIGNIYPFPLIEDGDFNIPVAYCTDLTGAALAAQAGAMFTLKMTAERIPATACNVIVRRQPAAKRKILVCAHIDARETTPGASDNASGTAVLMLLAELLADYDGALGIELAALNGEDHYSVAGQMDYLRRYGDGLKDIVLAINIDDVGCREGKTAYSFYECAEGIRQSVRRVLGGHGELTEGEPWYQGDHMIFAQQGIPALAVTAEKSMELLATVTHTPRDTPDLLDCRKIGALACALNALLRDSSDML